MAPYNLLAGPPLLLLCVLRGSARPVPCVLLALAASPNHRPPEALAPGLRKLGHAARHELERQRRERDKQRVERKVAQVGEHRGDAHYGYGEPPAGAGCLLDGMP